MSFNIISNLLIVFCVLGILVLFLRRIPEVVDEKGASTLGLHGVHGAGNSIAGTNGTALANGEVAKLSVKIGTAIAVFFRRIGQEIWHFMLEAKDLKEGRILASNFTKIVSGNSKKVVNIAAFNHLKKADRLIALGDLDAAEETYFEIIKKHPHEYPAYEGLIRVYTKQKKIPEIIETLNYLIAHNPANDNYYAQLGKTLLGSRRFSEAAEAYDKSLELNNLIPARYANAALSYQALGNLNKAKKYFSKALDLEPANVQYLMMLVDVQVKLGEVEEARERLEQALDLDPDNTLVREKLIKLQK